ncbi:MAG TPA: dipeptide epimerase [Candidatus Saccharicenans sp.]|jgi:L-alanine-DL-glutamate epimerase-like enolase superfamily enzyme|nr:dipeptide epimerase [Candidatus Saccharicenans sp.]HRD01793.1 dipeptide epimerase [Candidatus Saccharicenans sp.]
MKITRQQFLKYFSLGLASTTVIKKPSWPAGKMADARQEIKKMKIKKIEISTFDVPLTSPFRIAIGTMHAANDVLVKITTDSGLYGIGEACPFPPITGETQASNIAAARAIRELLKDKDPLAIEGLIEQIGNIVHSNPSTVAAYDMALYDLLGKAAGLPLYKLLGGYRSSFETDMTTGLNTPEKMVESVKDSLALGYRQIKIKVGEDPDLDVRRVQMVREAIGPDIPLRIDANQGWSVPQAIFALRRMEPFKVQFAEQPVLASDISGLKAVREQSPVPIMADESLFLPSDSIKLIKEEACAYFNIKLMKAGGLLNSLKIAHIAAAANIQCMVGCMIETRLALTAAAHLVASQKNIIFADLDGNSEHQLDPVIGGMKVEKGTIYLPEAPGLGCDVDPAFLKKMQAV